MQLHWTRMNPRNNSFQNDTWQESQDSFMTLQNIGHTVVHAERSQKSATRQYNKTPESKKQQRINHKLHI